MKEHLIIFSSAMIKAILEGRKTMTRRVVRPQPDEDGLVYDLIDKAWVDTSGQKYDCPYGDKGDRLWVGETWVELPDKSGEAYIFYKATTYGKDCKRVKWKPSTHMPRQVSRITLEITDVKTERLQDITTGPWVFVLKFKRVK